MSKNSCNSKSSAFKPLRDGGFNNRDTPPDALISNNNQGLISNQEVSQFSMHHLPCEDQFHPRRRLNSIRNNLSHRHTPSFNCCNRLSLPRINAAISSLSDLAAAKQLIEPNQWQQFRQEPKHHDLNLVERLSHGCLAFNTHQSMMQTLSHN